MGYFAVRDHVTPSCRNNGGVERSAARLWLKSSVVCLTRNTLSLSRARSRAEFPFARQGGLPEHRRLDQDQGDGEQGRA